MPQISQLSFVFASQFFWLAVVFGLIFFGIGIGMLPKVRSTVVARDTKVAEDLEKAKAARSDAEQSEADWRARMDKARQEAMRVAEDARSESARETEARVQEAVKAIDDKVHGARLRIRSAVEAARVELESVAAEATQQMITQLTGLKVDRRDAAEALAAELGALDARAGGRQAPPRQKQPVA
jgi:F-type H+-transporting ATPase subunit b